MDVSLRFGVPPLTRAFQSSTAVRDGRRKTGVGSMGLWGHWATPLSLYGLAIRLGFRMNCSFCVRHGPVKPT